MANPSGMSSLVSALGMLTLAERLEESGMYADALEWAQEAKYIYEGHGNINALSCVANMAMINTRLGYLELAQEQYTHHIDSVAEYIRQHEAVMAKKDVLECRNAQGFSVEKLAHIYFLRKKFGSAIALFKEANTLFHELHLADPQHPLYYRSYAQTFDAMGDVFESMKKYDLAYTCYSKFHELLGGLLKVYPENIELQFDIAKALNKLGIAEGHNNRLHSSYTLHKKALRYLRALKETHAHYTDINYECATTYNRIGSVCVLLNKKRLARKCFSTGAEVLRELTLKFAGNIWYREMLSVLLNNLGDVCATFEDYEEALAHFEESLKLKERLVAEKPDVVQMTIGIAVVHQHIGDVYRMQQNVDGAFRHYSLLYKATKSIRGYADTFPDQKRYLSIALGRMAMIHAIKGDLSPAIRYSKRSISLHRQMQTEFPLDTTLKDELAVAYQEIAEHYIRDRQIEKALNAYRKYYRLELELMEQFPENCEYRLGVSLSAQKVGRVYLSMGKFKDALSFFKKHHQLQELIYATSEREAIHFATNDLAVAYGFLGDVYSAMEKIEKGYLAYRQYYSMMKGLWQEHPEHNELYKINRVLSCYKLAILSMNKSNTDEAALVLEEARSSFTELMEANPGQAEYQWLIEEVTIYEQAIKSE